MPEFERYPNESPMAAKKRIAKNVARSRNNPNARNNPGAVNVPAGVAPRPVGNVPPVNVATKPEMMAKVILGQYSQKVTCRGMLQMKELQ